MKEKRWAILLAAVFAALAAAAALFAPDGGILIVLVLPFRWLGLGLRTLSLSGAAGNAAAIALMAMLSLLPLLPVLLDARNRRKASIEHAVCVLTAAVAPFILYRFINPQTIRQIFSAVWPASAALTMQGELMLSGCFWSLAAAYAVLRALRAYGGAAAEKGLRAVLILLTGAMLTSVFYIDLYELIDSVRTTAVSDYSAAELFAGGGAARVCQAADILLAALRFLNSAIPSLLLIWVFPLCFRLLRESGKDRFAEGNAQLALAAAKRARTAIVVSVLLGAGSNLVQILLARMAANVNIRIDLPLFELLTAFLLMLLSEGFRKGYELAAENRQFV